MRHVGSFPEFLKTGALGKVRPGASRSDVFQEFGAPERFSEGLNVLAPQRTMQESRSWIYGFLQLGFSTDVLTDIGFYYAGEDDGVTSPKSLQVDGLPVRSFSITELERTLERLNLLESAKLERYAGDVDPNGIHQFILSSGVCVLVINRKVLSIWAALDGPPRLQTTQEWYNEETP